jgi:predicted nuclease of restriction endonuclease-like (RecB) superfamily
VPGPRLIDSLPSVQTLSPDFKEKTMNLPATMDAAFITEVKQLIHAAKQRAVVAVNAELTLLYWQVGRRIADEVLQGERAEYGQQIVLELSKQLTHTFGKGWSKQQLHHCMRFAESFSEPQIVSTLSRQLRWSHFLELIYVKEPLARDFYAELCAAEGWSVRVLRQQVGSLLFERTALSKQPDELIVQSLQKLRNGDGIEPAFVLKDPYVLDFLELNDQYIEKDLEDAILRELEQFILELGAGLLLWHDKNDCKLIMMISTLISCSITEN